MEPLVPVHGDNDDIYLKLVRGKRLELLRVAPPAPQAGASTNSATRAHQ